MTEEASIEVASSPMASRPSRRTRNIFSRGDSSPSAMERFSAALASAAASVSHTFNPSSRSISVEATSTPEVAAVRPQRSRSTSPNTSPRPPGEQPPSALGSSNTLQVPGYGLGAIPRRPPAISRESSAESETMACFCGHYSEIVSEGQPQRRGRCRLCRSRAKYVPGQRSFDASRLFGRGRRERVEPRRAISEDQRDSDETSLVSQADERVATSTTSLDDAASTASSRRPWRLRPSVKRQARLELDVPMTSLTPAASASTVSPSRDHGLRTPPGPPLTASMRPRPTRLEEEFALSHRQATHVMASEMGGLLAPPPRTAALARAHTDPTSSASSDAIIIEETTPSSPPPSYEDVMKEPRAGPPSYEEALCSSVTSWRLGTLRSLSADERFSTGHPSPPPPFRSSNGGRNNSSSIMSPRPLVRSSRAEEIPDIYWEQAARELDFCTCRKCQARYRQYFEEDLDPNSNDEAMIPMETQVLMQEVLTDGMAFCALM